MRKEQLVQPAVAAPEFPQAPGNAIPEEILARWSWGPFFLWLFWVWWNADQKLKIAAAVIFVCEFIPFINFLAGFAALALAIYLGLKGNRIMAANRQFTSVEQFVAVQTAWAKWGVIVLIVSVALGILSVVLFGAAMMAAGVHSASYSR
jgi:hypothetical protein